MSAPRLPLATRVSAWIVTGPLGHLHGGIVDWFEVAAKLTLARARGRARRTSDASAD